MRERVHRAESPAATYKNAMQRPLMTYKMLDFIPCEIQVNEIGQDIFSTLCHQQYILFNYY